MKKKILVLGLCSLFLATGCGHQAKLKDGKEVIASVDGKEIVAEDLFDKLKKQYGTTEIINMIDEFIADKEIENSDESKEYAKSQVAVLEQQYKTYGYDFDKILTQYGYNSKDELIDEYAKSHKKSLVVKKYLKENKVTEDEIKKYYDEEIFDSYSVKHILIKSKASSDASDEEKTNAENEAKEKAMEVINKLNDGANWSDLVKEYSEDTGSVDADGLIENFTKGDVVDEFFEASSNLKDDEYTKEPVKSTYGYHVILKVSTTEKASLEDKKESIMDELVKNYLSNDSNLESDTWVEIRKSYNLAINDSTIESNYEKSIEK